MPKPSGRHIIHMEVGQPGTAAPEGARAALTRAMREDALGYTVALGLPALRQRIARLYGEWYGVDLDPARVVITPGSSGAFILAFTALFDAGDRVGNRGAGLSDLPPDPARARPCAGGYPDGGGKPPPAGAG